MMPACLRFTRKEVKEISPTEEINLASSAMRLMLSLLDEFQPGSDESTPCQGSNQTRINT
jgi:dynein heavy chain, axonemal